MERLMSDRLITRTPSRKRLYFGSYPIGGGFAFGIAGSRYDPCCSPDNCRRWAYRLELTLFIRGFEIEYTTPENRA